MKKRTKNHKERYIFYDFFHFLCSILSCVLASHFHYDIIASLSFSSEGRRNFRRHYHRENFPRLTRRFPSRRTTASPPIRRTFVVTSCTISRVATFLAQFLSSASLFVPLFFARFSASRRKRSN